MKKGKKYKENSLNIMFNYLWVYKKDMLQIILKFK